MQGIPLKINEYKEQWHLPTAYAAIASVAIQKYPQFGQRELEGKILFMYQQLLPLQGTAAEKYYFKFPTFNIIG